MLPLRAVLTALALTALPAVAWAQTPSPALPPGYAPTPGYAPPGYAPPPPGYAPPPGYLYHPAPGYPARGPLGPARLPYEEGNPVPHGYHLGTQVRTGLIIGGSLSFGTMYAFSVVAAATSSDQTMAIPIVGPFITVGRVNFGGGPVGKSASTAIATLLIVDGVAQVAGLGMLIAAVAHPQQVLVRDDIATPTVRVTPLTMGYGGLGAGIGIVGTM